VAAKGTSPAQNSQSHGATQTMLVKTVLNKPRLVLAVNNNQSFVIFHENKNKIGKRGISVSGTGIGSSSLW